MKRIQAWIELFRIELPLAAGICVLLGEVLAAGKIPPAEISLAAFLAVFFISSSANILNDYFDLETDRINAPGRPLPSGRVRPGEVIFLTALTSILGLGLAGWIGLPALLTAFASWLAAFLYNWRLKAAGLTGNLLVSSCVAGTFIFGGIAAGRPWDRLVWSFAMTAFFFDLGEEIASGAMDAEGDRQRGSKSLAIIGGGKTARVAAGVAFGLSIAIASLPRLFGWLGGLYLWVFLVMAVLVAYFTVRFMKSRTAGEGRMWLRWNYLGASLCLLAFLLGRLA